MALLCLLFLVVSAQAQDKAKAAPGAKKAAPAAAAAMPMPKPAPELGRLAYFAGNWTSEGTMQPSPFGAGGKFSGKEHDEWFPGKFFLVSHADSTMPGMGPMKEMAIFGYDPEKKVYTYHAINSMGEAETYTGTVKDKDWTWDNKSAFQGKTYNNRFSLHEDSPTAYTMKFDMSDDGGKTWKTAMDGKAKKAAAK